MTQISRASHASRGSCECTSRALVPFAGQCRTETHPTGALTSAGFSVLFSNQKSLLAAA